jgi:hypothetical protein
MVEDERVKTKEGCFLAEEIAMKKLILDERLCSQLNGLTEEIEVCDESGQTVGYILPDDLYQELMYAYYGEPPITVEEREAVRKFVGKGVSTEEVLKRLEEK